MQNEEQLPLKDIYCTKCQEETPHSGSMDQNGEFVFHCTKQTDIVKKKTIRDGQETEIDEEVPHHFVKFPADVTPEEFEALVDIHHVHNQEQIQVSKQQEKLKLLLGVSLKNADQNVDQGTDNSVSSETPEIPANPEQE